MNPIKVGIEAIAFDVPEHFIRLQELAVGRGIDPQKYISGLGQIEMSVPTPCEDTVVLATNAASKLMNSFEIEKDSIGLLIVGTETGVDHSKPVSSYVHELLDLSSQCRVYETKHACYGGMAGLSIATDWVLSGRAKGKKALIIASDIAYYGLRSAGEPTQGAGAVAFIVSDQPHLMELEAQYEGIYAKQVMDFWRPLYSKEAFAEGHFSIRCYLEALSVTYQTYRKSVLSQTSENLSHFSEQFDACLYHVPFVKMAQKAHLKLLGLNQEEEMINEKSQAVEDPLLDFNRRVAPWLEMNARVGNLYTGSIFLSLFHYLQSASTNQIGKRISLFCYGSGCAAEFLSGKVGSEIIRMKKITPYQETLEARRALTLEGYESMITAYSKADRNGAEGCDPELWDLKRPLTYLGTHEHKRRYAFIR